LGGKHSMSSARHAIRLALTETRAQEEMLKQEYRQEGCRAVAIDFGGEFIGSVKTIVERAVVASKREGLIVEDRGEEGAVAGATREAISQLTNKALGLNTGGKIALVRQGEDLSVAIFCSIGLLHLNEVGIGLGHRVLYYK
jgi:uncharacterized protein related to proFAR isomerase